MRPKADDGTTCHQATSQPPSNYGHIYIKQASSTMRATQTDSLSAPAPTPAPHEWRRAHRHRLWAKNGFLHAESTLYNASHVPGLDVTVLGRKAIGRWERTDRNGRNVPRGVGGTDHLGGEHTVSIMQD